ncbi:MAG: metal ABC transporter permease [Candidatus Nitrosopolaris sp.]
MIRQVQLLHLFHLMYSCLIVFYVSQCALSHAAFGGIAVGLFTSIYPLWTALVISVLSALGITKLRQSTKIPPDAAVAVMLSSGLAMGIVLIGLAGGFNLDLESFLFGSILLISMQDQIMILLLSAVVMVSRRSDGPGRSH